MRCLLFLSMLLLGGCHARQRYIQATISNRSGHPLQTLELDYPSASFGTQSLADNADFHYRFLVQGPSTPAKLSFLSPRAPQPMTLVSPFSLHPGDEGSLTVTINAEDEALWSNTLSARVN